MNRFHNALIAALVLFGPPASGVEIGFNKVELLQQYLGTASGGDGSERYRKVTIAMARKAMADARDLGVPFLRFAAAGYSPIQHGGDSDLKLWMSDPARHWEQVDRLFSDADAVGLRVVPTFIWNVHQFPALTGETVRDLLTNAQSRSSLLAARYIREFVGRYSKRRTILFYELTNELNLSADLDLVKRCSQGAYPFPPCSTVASFSTAEMVAFTGRLAFLLRQLDGERKISSGFDVPRRAAEHLRARPEWSAEGGDFSLDSKEQFGRNLLGIHEALDIISVHLYPTQENARFGAADPTATALLDEVYKIAKESGKPLFVGEFGDPERSDARPDAYNVRMLHRIVRLQVDYSAMWAWQYYQTSLHSTRDSEATRANLEPGATDELLKTIREINRGRAAEGDTADLNAPRIVLTWPLACAAAKPQQLVHVVASDDSGKLRTVEFLLDDILVASASSAPYATTIPMRDAAPGEHTIIARASDGAGNVARATVTVVVGRARNSVCRRIHAQ
jgi:hypothetical protein